MFQSHHWVIYLIWLQMMMTIEVRVFILSSHLVLIPQWQHSKHDCYTVETQFSLPEIPRLICVFFFMSLLEYYMILHDAADLSFITEILYLFTGELPIIHNRHASLKPIKMSSIIQQYNWYCLVNILWIFNFFLHSFPFIQKMPF